MKLFTGIYDDARLLRPFLNHYHALGVLNFLIALSPLIANSEEDYTSDYPVSFFRDLDVRSHMLGGTAAVTEMRRAHQAPDEWVVIVDLDEFIEPRRKLNTLIGVAEAEGANVIRGIMLDRFTYEGTLPEICPDSVPAEIFPIKARFIRDVMGGRDFKGVPVKGTLSPVNAHHLFEGEIVSSLTVEIDHFKWCAGAIDRLRTRYHELIDQGIPFAAEYKKILDHYDRYNRFVWQEFGGIIAEFPEERSVGPHAAQIGSGQAVPHPRDITADDLEHALAAADDPDLLQELVTISRSTFGFYVGQFTYTINYTWVAARLRDLPPGSRLLDIGAGVTPVPLWLANRGMLVDCVDPHPVIRTLPADDDLERMGFLRLRSAAPEFDLASLRDCRIQT